MTDSPPLGSEASAGRILGRTLALVRGDMLRVAAAVAMLTAAGAMIDSGALGSDATGFLNLLVSVLGLLAQYWLTRTALRQISGREPEHGRLVSLFVMNLLVVLAILLGLVLLIVPGLILIVRWSIAVPILLDSSEGVVDSLGASWRATEGRFWPILAALLAFYGPGMLLAVALAAIEAGSPTGLAALIAMNLLLNLVLAAGWYASVAIYSLLQGPASLSRIFE